MVMDDPDRASMKFVLGFRLKCVMETYGEMKEIGGKLGEKTLKSEEGLCWFARAKIFFFF